MNISNQKISTLKSFDTEIADKKLPEFEKDHKDLMGVVSIILDDKTDFNSLAARMLGYDKNEYEAVALRVYISSKPVVTVYARYKNKPSTEGKLMVHKFKKEMSLDDLFFQLHSVNFTVSNGEFDIENMEVVNK